MYEERIAIDPAVRHGKPIIKGTRVPLEIIIGSLAGGMEIEEIVKEYDLQKEDILATLAQSARILQAKRSPRMPKPKFDGCRSAQMMRCCCTLPHRWSNIIPQFPCSC